MKILPTKAMMDESLFHNDHKISKFENYQLELEINRKIFNGSRNAHLNQLRSDISKVATIDFNPVEYYVGSSEEDLLVAITDDLLRYCTYHDISTIEYNFINEGGEKNQAQVFSVSESVRASFFTKWVLKLRPCIAAQKKPGVEKRRMLENSKSGSDLEEFRKAFHRLQFCNEYLALYCASNILKIRNSKKQPAVTFILSLFDGDSRKRILYSLRYRMHHQDAFNLFYLSLFSQYRVDELRQSE